MILAGIPGIAGANPPVTETSVSGFIARAPAAIVSCRSARGGGRLLTDIATATGLVATTGTVATGGAGMGKTPDVGLPTLGCPPTGGPTGGGGWNPQPTPRAAAAAAAAAAACAAY